MLFLAIGNRLATRPSGGARASSRGTDPGRRTTWTGGWRGSSSHARAGDMTPDQFAQKWERAQLRERAGSQEHFLDICRLVGERTPAEVDPNGEFFTFEKSLRKESGATGFADVWRRGCFAWEYKGLHADLSSAYSQLQLYRESLGNPPLLVVCDMDRYEVHTNFNNTVKRIYRFSNIDIPSDESVDGTQLTAVQILRTIFAEPDSLNPGKSQAKLTEEAADLLVTLAEDLRRWNAVSETPIPDQRIAKFIMRMIFCFFACDVGLLPKDAFADLIRVNRTNPQDFRRYLSRTVRRDERRRQLPHAKSPAIQRRVVRRYVRAQPYSEPGRDVRAVERS